MKNVYICFLVGVLGCGEKSESEPVEEADTDTDTDTDTDSDTDADTGGDTGTPMAACSTLTPTACGSRSDCSVIAASPVAYDATNNCYVVANTIDQLGCMDADMLCGEAISFGSDGGNSGCYYFTNTCLPTGWTGCTWPGPAGTYESECTK